MCKKAVVDLEQLTEKKFRSILRWSKLKCVTGLGTASVRPRGSVLRF